MNDLKELGIPLLIDERTVTETRLGKVEIFGTDFRYNKRKEPLVQLAEDNPRLEDSIARFWLVHNPFDFKYIKDGECDLCFRFYFLNFIIFFNFNFLSFFLILF